MYKETLIIIITVLIIYYFFFYEGTEYFKADNGKEYKIVINNDDEAKIKANFLAKLDDNINVIINDMYDKSLPNSDISKRLKNKYDSIELKEIPKNENGAAYTINKGDIYMCIIKDNKLNDINDAMFVLLHELAHLMSISFGHGSEFKKNFDFIVKHSVLLNKYKSTNYKKYNSNYCGIDITTSPCDNGQCDEDNLNFFYKENLMDYK